MLGFQHTLDLYPLRGTSVSRIPGSLSAKMNKEFLLKSSHVTELIKAADLSLVFSL